MARTVGNPAVIALNAVAAGLGIYALNYLIYNVQLPAHLAGAGQWQFLTNLSLLFSVVVFGLGIAAHATRSQQLFTIKNNLHPVALALECVVTMVYWPLRLMFLHILIKDSTIKLIPMYVDVCLHLVPVVALLIDFFFFMPRCTVTPRIAFSACVVLGSMYWIWLKRIIDFENGGEYPYVFLNGPSEVVRGVIFSVICLVGFGSFLSLTSIYDRLIDPVLPKRD